MYTNRYINIKQLIEASTVNRLILLFSAEKVQPRPPADI